MTSKRCKCGHLPSVHRGRDTRCLGSMPDGENALGYKLTRICPCAVYRRTERSRWDVLTMGTEECPLP